MKLTREEAVERVQAMVTYMESLDADEEELKDMEAYRMAIKALEQEPTTGHWIWDSKNNIYRCSCCNHFPWRINTEENDEVFIDMKRTNAYKFCPSCGKKMVEPQEREDKE